MNSFGSILVGRCCKTTACLIGANRSFIRAGYEKWANRGFWQVKGIWGNDAMRETELFVCEALCEVSDAVNLVTSLSKVYFSKGSMKGGKVIVMGCW